MKRHLSILLALLMTLTAALGLTENALAASGGGSNEAALAAFGQIPYHGDPAACAMTAAEARALAVKLGDLMTAENDNSYKDDFIRRAALVDLGGGVPALYYFDGVSAAESANPAGPGLSGAVDYFTENSSAWEFKNGALTRFYPGWFHGDFMVYQNLSGNGRSGGSYVVPIENGAVNIFPDEYGFAWVETSQSVAWHEWYLGSMGMDYEDTYDDLNAGTNNEYAAVLEDPADGAPLGVFEERYAGLGEAMDVWEALDSYACAREAADASDPNALIRGYGDADVSSMSPELLRAYVQTLRGLPDTRESWSGIDRQFSFASLIRGGDGTVLLWVIPAVEGIPWLDGDQGITYSGASFLGCDHRLFGWDGAGVREISIPGVNRIRWWPEGVEFTCTYEGNDADGQNWELMYTVENGGIASQPQWCHSSGFLYDYALEEAGIPGGVPADSDACRSVTQAFFDYETGTGAWPELPVDWSTFTRNDIVGDCILYDVYSSGYTSFALAHRLLYPDSEYTAPDTSAAGTYSSIGDGSGRWLRASVLADRLDAAAALLEESAKQEEPPTEEPAAPEPSPDEGASANTDTPAAENTAPEEPENAPAEEPEAPKKEKSSGLGFLAVTAGGALIVSVSALALVFRSRRKKSAPASDAPQPQTQPGAFCPYCGTPHQADAKFCPNCGKKL